MKGRRKTVLIAVLLCLVMAGSVIVRVPAWMGFGGGDCPDAYTDQEGLPYFNQMDAYYHLRMMDEIAEKGSFGETDPDTGARMDLLRLAPEGMRASYHAGIIHAAIVLWRGLRLFTPVDLHTAAYFLSCIFAALTALAVFFLGKRISGAAGGLFAAVFVSCAPAFAARTMAGSFDTDMVQILFTTLMMLFMTQTLLSRSFGRAVLHAALTASAAAGFTLFWSVSSLWFVLVTYLGGAASLGALLFAEKRMGKRFRERIRKPAVWGYLLSALLSLLLLLLLHGPSYIKGLTGELSAVTSGAAVLPNMMDSVGELQRIPFGPAALGDWFRGFIPEQETVVNGTGGGVIWILAGAGLAVLVLFFLRSLKKAGTHPAGGEEKQGFICSPEEVWTCGPVLVVWLVFCLYGVRLGSRFTEHLAAPLGILAGLVPGLAVNAVFGRGAGGQPENGGAGALRNRVLAMAVAALGLWAACLTPAGAYRGCTMVRPAVTDASEKAMDWIRQDSKQGKAVIASWWDGGYYYEYEAKRPTLWDGGSQDSLRAIVIGKALAGDDMERSRMLLRMLASSGTEAVRLLAGELGWQGAFEVLWETAAMDRQQTLAVLQEDYGIPSETAQSAEKLIHPENCPDVYLVLTGAMMMRLGLIEYYADWDFTGEQQLPEPAAAFLPAGNSGQEQDAIRKREAETFWKLYLQRSAPEGTDACFELGFEIGDGQENVQVWRVNETPIRRRLTQSGIVTRH